MTIDALPTAPNRNMTPEAFIAAADTFVAALNTMVSQTNTDLNLVLNLSGLLATSASSVLIGTGAKSFTVETGKAFLATQSVRAYSTASPTNYMLGTVTSYDAGTGALVLDVTSVGGSGTLADWTIVLAASGEWLGNATTATTATNQTGGYSLPTSMLAGGDIGFFAGAGGQATQSTSKSTAVALGSAFCGKITTSSESLAAGATVTFVVTSTAISAIEKMIIANHHSGGTKNAYSISTYSVASGGEFEVTIKNTTAGDLAEAIVIDFIIFNRPVA